MTNPQIDLIGLAKQGNVKAIAALINRQLQPKGITTQLMLKNGCLQILLEAAQIPNQQSLTAFILKGIKGLEVTSIKKIKIFARQSGEKNLAWSQEVALVKSLNQVESKPIALPIKAKQTAAKQTAAKKVEEKTAPREIKKSTVLKLSYNLTHQATQTNLLTASRLFFTSKKGVAIVGFSAMGVLILSIGYGIFPSQETAFRDELSRLLNSSGDPSINLRVQKSFDDRFGYERARELGRNYCEQRSRGVSDREISRQTSLRSLNLMSEGKVTAEEATTLALVDISIVLAAQRTYCPEFESN